MYQVFTCVICCISDIRDLELPKTCETEFPDPDDLLNFKLVISPDEVRKALTTAWKLSKTTSLSFWFCLLISLFGLIIYYKIIVFNK